MATSGSKSVTVTSWDTLKFSWSESSQSIANNTTTISWKLELIAGSSGRISSTASKSWSVTVNGTKYSGTNTVGIANNATKTLASGTTTITHASNGTKTFTYSFSQQFSITFSGSSIGTISGSGSGTLDTIPRKSTLSVANGNLNTAQTLTVTKQDSGFTHTITYKCGSTTGTICTKSSSTSISFTPPLSLANQNTTGTTLSITYTITTYSGNTSLGSNSYTKSLGIPATVTPTVSLSVSDAQGYATTYGGYIQGKSKAKIVLTASGVYGSTIKSQSTTFDGSIYTTATITSTAIKGTGTLTISCTVVDSRGRKGTATASISVLAYSDPSFGAVSVTRCAADGTEDQNGAYIKATFNAWIRDLNNKNTVTYVGKYKPRNLSTYTEVVLSDYTNVYDITKGSFIFPADTSLSYDVALVATDAFVSTQRTIKASSVAKFFSILAKGKGFAFGKIAELSNFLEVAWNARVLKNFFVGDKLAHNDGATGWYFGYDGTAHATHATKGPCIGFHFKGSTSNTSLIEETSSGVLSINGREYGTNKVLWSGAWFMNASQTATLSQAVSAQPNGIVLIFSKYSSGAANTDFHSFFVPKYLVSNHAGVGQSFIMSTTVTISSIANKYLYIHNTKITGNGNNEVAGSTTSGITRANNQMVLRYVIGV